MAQFVPVTLPELTYGYNALEPILIGEILEVHHKKHHQAYVNNYNAAAEHLAKAIARGDASDAQVTCAKVAFNAGGHLVHSWYWENLAPAGNGGGVLPDEKSPFTQAVVNSYGSYDNLKNLFNQKTIAIQGSGWGWLALDPATKNLSIETTLNQDQVETKGLIPLLTVDVWEHAYYLQYKNLRPDYVQKIWGIINWRTVEERYLNATGHQKL